MTLSYGNGALRPLLVFAALSSCCAAAQSISVAAAMMQAARASGVPVGIVLRKGNDLCGASIDSVGDRGIEPLQRLRRLARTYGYHMDTRGPVISITPKTRVPKLLEQTLQHVWPRGPGFDSILREMGMILNGWMSMVAGAKGWGMDSGSGPDEPVLHLAAGENISSQQIANRIVSLDGGGVWVAWQSPATVGSPRDGVNLVTLSYLKYDENSINTFRCE